MSFYTIITIGCIFLGISVYLSTLAHKKHKIHQKKRFHGLYGIELSKKIVVIIDELISIGCDNKLIQILNGFMTYQLAHMAAIDMENPEIKRIGKRAIEVSEMVKLPDPVTILERKDLKEKKNRIYQARLLLPAMVKARIIKKEDKRHWQHYLHNLKIETVTKHHIAVSDLCMEGQKYGAALNHLNQATLFIKKNPFKTKDIQEEWLNKLHQMRIPIMDELEMIVNRFAAQKRAAKEALESKQS